MTEYSPTPSQSTRYRDAEQEDHDTFTTEEDTARSSTLLLRFRGVPLFAKSFEVQQTN